MHRHRTRVAGRTRAMSRATQTHKSPWQGQRCRWSSADAVWTTYYTLLGEDNHGHWGRGKREGEGGKRSNLGLIHSCSSLSALAWFCWPQLPPVLLLCHSRPLTAWTCTVGTESRRISQRKQHGAARDQHWQTRVPVSDAINPIQVLIRQTVQPQVPRRDT